MSTIPFFLAVISVVKNARAFRAVLLRALVRPPWISLDSLVRIETYQWVTRLEAALIFPCASSAALSGPGLEPAVLACGSPVLFMGQAYLDF